MATFVQIHTLTGYSGVLLNRDDSGMAKRIVYGDSERVRISSQFIKRKLRLADGPHALTNIGTMGVRSRLIFPKKVAEPLIEEGYDREQVIEATLCVIEAMFGVKKDDSKRDKSAKKDKTQKQEGPVDRMSLLERKELIIMGEKEIEYVKTQISSVLDGVGLTAGSEAVAEAMNAALKDKLFKENLRKMRNISLDVAAFGRMSTGDALSTVDAAVHVSHAFTVNETHSETDYFTAVDDLKDRSQGDDGGAAHVGETELNSPLLYGYYVVDVDQLVRNLGGLDEARDVAAEVAANLVHLVSTEVVGAKKGGTAPYSSADFVLVEIGDQMPRTLAEAFRQPAKSDLNSAVDQLSSYLANKEGMYGAQADHRLVASVADVGTHTADRSSLPELCGKVSEILGDR